MGNELMELIVETDLATENCQREFFSMIYKPVLNALINRYHFHPTMIRGVMSSWDSELL